MSTHPAHTLLARAHSPSTASSLFTAQVQYRPLLLRPSSPPHSSTTSPRRSARRATRHAHTAAQQRGARHASNSGRASFTPRPQPLSARAQRRLGVYEVPRSQRRWALHVGLHALWCSYVREVLGYPGRGMTVDGAGPLLASADFHGALVQVVRSGCVSRVGLEGIVVRDTKFTFELVTRKDRLVVVPKEGTVFRVEIPAEGNCVEEKGKEEKGKEQGKRLVLEVYGEQIMTAAPDRANKKFKMHLDSGV